MHAWTQGPLLSQCAESNVYVADFYGRPAVVKERPVKAYRHPTLDQKIREQRTAREARALVKCKRIGVPAPDVYAVDKVKCTIVMERLSGVTVRDFVNACPVAPGTVPAGGGLADADPDEPASTTLPPGASSGFADDGAAASPLASSFSRAASTGGAASAVLGMVGAVVGKLHEADKIHGDLTTSNFILVGDPAVLLEAARRDEVPPGASVSVIDFGLVRESTGAEERAVDLYVLERAITSTHPLLPGHPSVHVEKGYRSTVVTKGKAEATLVRLKAVRARGRKRSMIG